MVRLVLQTINPKVHILGAGPAGLAAGYYAKKHNIPFHIFESTSSYGGNCRTIIDGEFRYDTGAHRLHDKIRKVTNEVKFLMGDELQLVNSPSKIIKDNHFIDFPLTIPSLFNYMNKYQIKDIILENFMNLFSKGELHNFKDFAYAKYGPTLSELFLINYTEKLWGLNSELLHKQVAGDRLNKLGAISILKKMIFKDRKAKHLDGSFYYPKKGFGTIFDKVVEYIGIENISFNSPIRKIMVNKNRITRIFYGQKSYFNARNVINTLPLDFVFKIMRPKPIPRILEGMDSIKFRKLRLCILFLDIPYVTNNASLYFPESSIPITRVYEPKNRSNFMAPENKTCLIAEIPCSENDEAYHLSPSKLSNLVKNILIEHDLFKSNVISKMKTINLENAYPILAADHYNLLKDARLFLRNFRNNYMFGRNAEFRYIHTHNIFEKAEIIIKSIV